MTDTYAKLANGKWTRGFFKALNLPQPVTLKRFDNSTDIVSGDILIGAAKKPELVDQVVEALQNTDVHISYPNETKLLADLNPLFNASDIDSRPINLNSPVKQTTFNAIIFDASGIKNSEQLKTLHLFFQPVIKRIAPCSRIVILTRPSHLIEDIPFATAQRALEGFSRSVAKEIGKSGSTCQLVHVEKGAEALLAAPLHFLLSSKSAYISGQIIDVKKTESPQTEYNWEKPLTGKTALVTGASRGIGAAIAETLTRDGAHVICLDIPAAQQALEAISKRLGGDCQALDITATDAPEQIASFITESGLDIIVHNAGVTRDKTLAKMTDDHWDVLMDINLSSMERINEKLLSDSLIRPYGRIICVSSMSGIAGNFGQTNYATSKAAVIGYVSAMQQPLSKLGITINAVAPGFIETQMTAAMPFTVREAGRRMNSLKQGGKPIDVAEAIAFFAQPQSAGVTGNTIRVCGQSLIGA